MTKIPFLLIAAGPSSRLGQPKQLLPWGNKTLIEHQVQTMLDADQDVNVVLGAFSELTSKVLDSYPVTQFIFENWNLGMGSSISFGVKSLIKKFPRAKAIIISLVDQPLITKEHYKSMTKVFSPGTKQIVISKSENGWIGPPVLFDSCYFKDLEQLRGEEGAKSILKKVPKSTIVTIDAGAKLSDIDSKEAYEKLIRQANI